VTDEKVTEPLADEVVEAIKTRVRDFYAKARQDYLLGPIFNSTVKEWDVHLQVITNFWSKVLLQLPLPLAGVFVHNQDLRRVALQHPQVPQARPPLLPAQQNSLQAVEPVLVGFR